MAGETVVGVLRADLSLDTAEFQAGAQRAKKTLGGLKNDFDNVNNATRKSGGFGAGFSDFVSKNDWKIKQFSMQMSQMAQSISATGMVVQAVSMQLPDMAAMLGGKFFLPAMIISSVAAMAAPMIASFLDTSKAAEEAEKQIDKLSEALQNYSKNSKVANMNAKQLTEEFGRYGAAARENAAYTATQSLAEMKAAIAKADGGWFGGGSSVFASIDETTKKVAELNRQLKFLESEQKAGLATSEQIQNVKDSIGVYEEAAEKAAKSLGLTREQATKLAATIEQLRNTKSSDFGQIGALAQSALSQIYAAVPNGQLPEALATVKKALLDIATTAQQTAPTLESEFNALSASATTTAQTLSENAQKAREIGNTGLAMKLQEMSAAMQSLVLQYDNGVISGNELQRKLTDIAADAGSADGSLRNIDGATFGNVLAGLEALRQKAAEVAAAAAAAAAAANVRSTINNQTSRGFSPGSVSFGNPFSGTTVSRNDPLGDGVVAPIESAGARAQTWVATQMRSTQLSKEQLRIETEIATVKREAAAAGQQITDEQARQIAQSRLQQQTGFKDAGGGGGGGGGSSTDKYTQTITRLKDQIAAARLEMTQGALAAQIYNQQIAAGVAPASAAGQQIATLATQLDALQQKQQLVEGIKGAFGQFFTSILTGSASAKEALGQLFASIAQALAQAAINKLFSTIFAGTVFAFANGTGPGGVPGFANGTLGIPGYANGTSAAQRLAMVGERGPELVSIAQGSRVYSKSETQRMLSQGGGRGGQLGISLADGLKAEWIGEAANNSVSITQNAFKQYDKSFNARSAKYKNDPRSRG